MTNPSIAFFDPAARLYGTARAGATLIFRGASSTVVGEGPRVEPAGDGVRAELDGRLALQLQPIEPEVDLGDVTARLARVSGTVGEAEVSCLGTLSETRTPPSWDELDALRSISVLVDEQTALLALARRPRGARGHGEELVTARLVREGQLHDVEQARLSTVYDGEGRQRSAGVELWMPGEEFPRRGSGIAIAGSSLELEGLHVHAAVFRWRLEGREGFGAYELMVRPEEPAAA